MRVTEKRGHKLHTPELIELLEKALKRFAARRFQLLEERKGRYAELIEGKVPGPEPTEHIRISDWTIEALPERYADQRSNLIGSANRNDLINGLNSNASLFFADMWNMVPQKSRIMYRAHRNISRAVKGQLSMLKENAKQRVQSETQPALVVVPRPIHVVERTVEMNGQSVPAAVYDILVHCVHNGAALIKKQGAILFGLRRVFSHLEARWFDSFFSFIESELGFKRGSIKTYIFIDSVESALETDEILFELRNHACGLSMDIQRYTFSHVQLFQGEEADVMPDREDLGLSAHYVQSLCKKILSVAHRRGAHALFPVMYELHPSELELPQNVYQNAQEEVLQGILNGFDGAIFCSDIAMNAMTPLIRERLKDSDQRSFQVLNDVKAEDLTALPEGELSTGSLISLVRTVMRCRMAEQRDMPYAIQGGKKHDRSSMKLCIGLLKQWRNSNKGVITATGLPVDDQLLKYLIEKETKKMFGHDQRLFEQASQEASFILDKISA